MIQDSEIAKLRQMQQETNRLYKEALRGRLWADLSGVPRPDQGQLESAWKAQCDKANRLAERLVSRLENYRTAKEPPYWQWDMTRAEAREIISRRIRT